MWIMILDHAINLTLHTKLDSLISINNRLSFFFDIKGFLLKYTKYVRLNNQLANIVSSYPEKWRISTLRIKRISKIFMFCKFELLWLINNKGLFKDLSEQLCKPCIQYISILKWNLWQYLLRKLFDINTMLGIKINKTLRYKKV